MRPGPIDDASSALYLADDFLNCSYKKRGQMKQALRKKHPNTMRYVERIVRIASQHDLLNPEQSIAFRRRLIKELKLRGVWSEQDDVSRIKDLILKVEGIAS